MPVTVIIRPLEAGCPADLGQPRLPGSKSHTQRALVLAGLTPRRCVLRGALESDDSRILAGALTELGAVVHWQRDRADVVGGETLAGVFKLSLGENGTALRVLGTVLSLLEATVELDAAESLRRRPLAPLLDALRAAGVTVIGDRLPVRVNAAGVSWPEQFDVDGRLTTQVGSGAILGLCLRRTRGLPQPARVAIRAPAAVDYLEVTAAVCRAFGYPVVLRQANDGVVAEVGAYGPGPGEYRVPVDASALAFPAVLAAMHDLEWEPPARGDDPHPDWAAIETVGRMRGCADLDIADLGRTPDSFPALAVLAACRQATTRLRGAPALRAKESDRIAAMVVGLRTAGCAIEELADGCVVRGPPRTRTSSEPLRLPAPADHRVVMALALLGTWLPGGVRLDHATAVSKSWPGFWDWLGRVTQLEFVR